MGEHREGGVVRCLKETEWGEMHAFMREEREHRSQIREDVKTILAKLNNGMSTDIATIKERQHSHSKQLTAVWWVFGLVVAALIGTTVTEVGKRLVMRPQVAQQEQR